MDHLPNDRDEILMFLQFETTALLWESFPALHVISVGNLNVLLLFLSKHAKNSCVLCSLAQRCHSGTFQKRWWSNWIGHIHRRNYQPTLSSPKVARRNFSVVAHLQAGIHHCETAVLLFKTETPRPSTVQGGWGRGWGRETRRDRVIWSKKIDFLKSLWLDGSTFEKLKIET